jgi:hypothetical protein
MPTIVYHYALKGMIHVRRSMMGLTPMGFTPGRMMNGRRPGGLYTVVTDEFVTAIRLAAVRAGSTTALAFEMGIDESRIRRVICQRIVSDDWVDRFCSSGLTELHFTDFEWMPWGELMNRLEKDWTHKRALKSAESRRNRARRVHESPDDGAEGVSEGPGGGQA